MFVLWCVLALADPDATIVVDAPVRTDEDTSAVVTVVDVDERLSSGADVADVVAQTPGAVVRRLGGLGDASGVSLRGGGLRDTLVLIDGVPLNPDGGSAVNLTELPLQAFGTVAVYRGGVPSERGANAMGGAIDLRSTTAEGPSLWASYGTLRTARTGALARQTVGDVSALVVVDALRTEGNFDWFDDGATPFNSLDDETRRRTNNDTAQGAGHAVVRVNTNHGELALLQSITGSEEGVPGPAGGLTDTVRFSVLRSLSSAQWTRRQDTHTQLLRVWGSVRQEALSDPNGEIGLTAEQTRDLASSLGARAVVEALWGQRLHVSAVVDARWDRYAARDVLRDVQPQARDRAVSRVSVAGHYRDGVFGIDPVLEAVWVQSVDGARIEPVPQLGLRVDVSDTVALKSRIQRALRPPDLVELYGDRGVIVGNATLRPETATQVDASLQWSPSERVRLELTPYAVFRQDGIVYIQNAQRTASPINLARSWRAGVEGAFNAATARWDLRTALALIHSVNDSPLPAYAGRRLPRTPAVVVDHATGVVLGSWRVGHTLHISSRRFLDPSNQTPSPGRVLNGAFVRGELLNGLTLELAVRNLGDERVQGVDRNPLSDEDDVRVDTAITDFTGYALPGRTWLMSLRYTP